MVGSSMRYPKTKLGFEKRVAVLSEPWRQEVNMLHMEALIFVCALRRKSRAEDNFVLAKRLSLSRQSRSTHLLKPIHLVAAYNLASGYPIKLL